MKKHPVGNRLDVVGVLMVVVIFVAVVVVVVVVAVTSVVVVAVVDFVFTLGSILDSQLS